MPKQFTLGKSERLKSRKAIDELFKNGKRFTVSPFRVFFVITKQTELQFGAGVSSKNFKKAVDRNKIKRLTRKAYRLQKNSLQKLLKEKEKGLNLFFIYTEKEIKEYQHIYLQTEKAIKKLSAFINEDIS